jgi:bifunctional non-homologous end joining protein LigD
VVFKRIFSPYTPGRPSTGGDQLKHKFHATVSAVVSGINEKRSVEISLLHEQQGWITAGKVAIPANQAMPPIGAVVEMPVCLQGKRMPFPACLPGPPQ